MGVLIDSVLTAVSGHVVSIVVVFVMSALISIAGVLLKASFRLSEDSLMHVRVFIDSIIVTVVGLVILSFRVMLGKMVEAVRVLALISVTSVLLEAGFRLSKDSLVHVGVMVDSILTTVLSHVVGGLCRNLDCHQCGNGERNSLHT